MTGVVPKSICGIRNLKIPPGCTFWMKVVCWVCLRERCPQIWGKKGRKNRAVRHNMNQNISKWAIATSCNQDTQHTGGKIWTWQAQIFDSHLFREEIHQFNQPLQPHLACHKDTNLQGRPGQGWDCQKGRPKWRRYHQLGIFLICKGPFLLEGLLGKILYDASPSGFFSSSQALPKERPGCFRIFSVARVPTCVFRIFNF